LERKKYSQDLFEYDGGKDIHFFPRISTTNQAYVTKGLEELPEFATAVQDMANLFIKVGKRILCALSDELNIKEEFNIGNMVTKSDHRLYLIKEKKSWLEKEGHNRINHSLAYGFLGMRLRSFKNDGFELHSGEVRGVDQNKKYYEPISVDKFIDDYEILVFVGKTLENITAGHFQATTYSDKFVSKDDNDDHRYVHFELEAKSGFFTNCKDILQDSKIVDIPPEYSKPIAINNDISSFSFTSHRVRTFDIKETNRKITDFTNSLFQVPGYLFKALVLKEDSESE